MALFLYPNEGSLRLAGIMRDTALATAGDEWSLGLFQNNILPGPSTVSGDLVEADFSGYALKALAAAIVGAVYLDPVLGGASFQIQWQWTFTPGGVVTNTVYGFFITDPTAGDKLVCIGTFDAPIPMAAGGDAIPLTVKLNYGG